ncbi:MAG: occludin [Bacteroides sp.]|nr:occludin [Bacteroides sp.]
MKRILLPLILILAGSTTTVCAQEEIFSDHEVPENVKSYGGFLLDMSLMQLEMPAPFLSKYTLEVPDLSKDYSFLFRLDPNTSYSTVTHTGSGWWHTPSAFGTFGTADNLQMGSFRLKNGMRINTYGQYNKEGWRMPSHSALPWERNNFRGAFELKSANGSFGIRVEVQQGR